MADAPAGWYPDPSNPGEEIYWLGKEWSGAKRAVHQIPESEKAGREVPPPPPAPDTAAPPAVTPPPMSAPAEPAASNVAPPSSAAAPLPPVAGSKPKNSLGMWAMIAGIVAFVSACIPGLSFVTWVPAAGAIVLGILGLRRKGVPHGQAISGLILGPIAFLVAIIVSVSFIATLGSTNTSANGALNNEPSQTGSSEQPAPSPTASSTTPTKASPYGVYPAAEATFVKTTETAEAAYETATTDLQRSQVIANRDAALCSAIGGNHVDGWVGTIHDIGANGDGYAWVNVEIAPTIVVQTWNNAFSDANSNTLIHQDASFFQTLVPMKIGQKITFSGDFLSSSDSCLDRENLTQLFYAADPNFIFRFSNVAPQ